MLIKIIEKLMHRMTVQLPKKNSSTRTEIDKRKYQSMEIIHKKSEFEPKKPNIQNLIENNKNLRKQLSNENKKTRSHNFNMSTEPKRENNFGKINNRNTNNNSLSALSAITMTSFSNNYQLKLEDEIMFKKQQIVERLNRQNEMKKKLELFNKNKKVQEIIIETKAKYRPKRLNTANKLEERKIKLNEKLKELQKDLNIDKAVKKVAPKIDKETDKKTNKNKFEKIEKIDKIEKKEKSSRIEKNKKVIEDNKDNNLNQKQLNKTIGKSKKVQPYQGREKSTI